MNNQKGLPLWALITLVTILVLGVFVYAWWYEDSEKKNNNINQIALDYLFNKRVDKIISSTYAPEGKSWFTRFKTIIHFNGINNEVSYIINNYYIIPESIKINYETKTLVFFEMHEGLGSQDMVVVLVEYDPFNDQVIDKLLVTNINDGYKYYPNTVINRMFQNDSLNQYVFYDERSKSIVLISVDEFKKQIIDVEFDVKSVFPYVLNDKIIFTAMEQVNQPIATQVYIFDLQSNDISVVDDDQLLNSTNISFTPGTCVPDDWGRIPTLRSDFKSLHSPNSSKIAVTNCSDTNIVDLDTNTQRIVLNEPTQLLGWINDNTLLLRRDNWDYAYEYVKYDLDSQLFTPLIDNSYFWDYFWGLSPDLNKFMYGASYINPDNNFPEVKSRGTTNLYLVDLINITEPVEIVTQLDMYYKPIWSPDSRYLLFSEVENHSITKRCILLDTQQNITQEIPDVRCVKWIPSI